MSRQKVRVAVVGVGMGSFHLDCYQKNPNAEIVAVCDLNEGFARDAAEKYGVPSFVMDYRELLNNKELDAVSIATPVFLHHEMTIDFLNAGKHVLVEKPMAQSLAKAEEMAAAAEKVGKILTVHHNRRYDSSTQFLKSILDEKKLGDVYFVRTGWRRCAASLITPTVERCGQVYNRSWFARKECGGGVLFDLGTHMIDRTMYLMGFPEVSRVMCATYNELGKIQEAETGSKFDAEDLATGLVQFKNGTSLQLEVSFGSYVEQDLVYSSFYGSRGGASDRDGAIKLFQSFCGATGTTTISDLPIPKIASPVDDFIASILEHRKPMITLEESLAVMRVLDLLRRSADGTVGRS